MLRYFDLHKHIPTKMFNTVYNDKNVFLISHFKNLAKKKKKNRIQ